jgi:hypothetical protein
VSKLPGDVAAEKKKTTQAQQTIDAHMTERKFSEHIVPYLDQLFRKAVIEWLIVTDQVCLLVLQPPNSMLTRLMGVMEAHTGSQTSEIQGNGRHHLPCNTRRQNSQSKSHMCQDHEDVQEPFNLTHKKIKCVYSVLHMFLSDIHQSDSVSGAVNITCDTWQAGNTDGYFTVTGHWIEENHLGQWECQSTLLRCTKVNNAHNGKHLGDA